MLGFDAVGRLALGQIRQDYTTASVNLTQAAGIGVAGGITPSPAAVLIGVSGAGIARSLVKANANALTGVSGTGIARSLTPLVATTINGVSGTGVARALAMLDLLTLAPAVGIGVAGIVTTSSTALTIMSAVGVGVAGQILGGPDGALARAVGIGIAGTITVMLSGGGGGDTSRLVEQPKRRDDRIKTGLLPLERRPVAPKPAPKKPLLPPTFDAPPLAPEGQPPIPDVAPATLYAFDDIARQITEAESAHAVGLKQSEHDEQDIADVLAALEMLD